MNEWKRPLPAIPGETMPFWNGCREGKLLLQQDQATGGFQWYPRSINTMTPGGKMNWVASSGKGTVWTFTITRQNRTPGFDDGPYVLALVELDEGVKLFTNIIECDPFDVRIGMEVEVTFVKANTEISVPFFKPIAKST
ncbi:uncharacterized protein METZ01_LOCUS163568 [marine metagenome]|uniref:Uncharacterized protein n=1 Tax=marine metagenome TaxID=408172 RepID=A0A382BAP9_9ZZZZ|nr:hypothetical protein [Dehalococcoidia bacterium]|tara:strand:- start:47 stop:463 length:417 start_codon:yes stop_codon:yes gene_type:complete